MTGTDTATQMTQGEDGNTKASSPTRARYWLYTWNNYEQSDVDLLKIWIEKNCVKGVFQPEIGKEGTKHLQGYFEFKNARTFDSLKKQWPKIHLEKARNREACIEYCQKSDTKDGNAFVVGFRPKTRDPLEGKTLKNWQMDILNMMFTEADERTINWYYDPIGNSGKTTLAKHLCLNHAGKILYISGKSADVKYGVKTFLDNENNDLKMAIFDFTRTVENFISYESIESIKNGIFYNTKYESGMVIFNCPHIVIFANFMPDMSKLSKDRWNVIDIEEEEIEY